MAFIPKNIFTPPKYGKTYGQRKNWLKNEEDARIYNGSRWRKFRLQYIQRHPFCVRCNKSGYYVDHIKPISEGGDIYNEMNLQTLCKRCNAIKTANQNKKD